MTRRVVATVLALIAVPLVVLATLWQTSRARTHAQVARAIESTPRRFADSLQAFSELERSADVIVERTASGQLLVRGRALQSAVALSTEAELLQVPETLAGQFRKFWPGCRPSDLTPPR